MSEERHHIVLCHPRIPQNTGSIARLCACTGATLHLIHPLGFSVDAASVRRAGLDYWPHVDIRNHDNFGAFLKAQNPPREKLFFFSKLSTKPYWDEKFTPPEYLIFGSESDGLPQELWQEYPDRFFQIPMRTHLVRSLNLSQCASLVLYEALRQDGFQA